MIVDEENPKGKIMSVGQQRAGDYDNIYAYWQSHIDLIKAIEPDYVVIEDFILYADKASHQTNSRMPTPKLIGILEKWLYDHDIPCYLQTASTAKARWSDKILIHKEYITKANNGRYFASSMQITKHIRDSIRHAVHFIHFTLPKIRS